MEFVVLPFFPNHKINQNQQNSYTSEKMAQKSSV